MYTVAINIDYTTTEDENLYRHKIATIAENGFKRSRINALFLSPIGIELTQDQKVALANANDVSAFLYLRIHFSALTDRKRAVFYYNSTRDEILAKNILSYLPVTDKEVVPYEEVKGRVALLEHTTMPTVIGELFLAPKDLLDYDLQFILARGVVLGSCSHLGVPYVPRTTFNEEPTKEIFVSSHIRSAQDRMVRDEIMLDGNWDAPITKTHLAAALDVLQRSGFFLKNSNCSVEPNEAEIPSRKKLEESPISGEVAPAGK